MPQSTTVCASASTIGFWPVVTVGGFVLHPILPPSAREALTKEAGCKSGESGKAYSRNTLKTQTYCENDGNWIHLAEDLEFWKKEEVEKRKFHYSYHAKSPSQKRSHSRNRS